MAKNYGMQAIKKLTKIKYLTWPSLGRIIGMQALSFFKF